MKTRIIILFILSAVLFYTCGDDVGGGKPETSPTKDKNIREYNLKVEEEQTKQRTPCDTLSLKQYIIDDYPAGDYLVEFDRTYTYTIPKPAVLYYKDDANYIFAVVAKSKEGERYIEPKNVVGYESSFINLDSTKLGTAFFYLTLFECDGDGNFEALWEAEVPIHGGFNSMTMHTWRTTKKAVKYIKLNFEAGIISGHRDYNYFLIDGIRNKPHLMETYEGIAHKRILANVNNDFYPDYYEFRFIDTLDYNKMLDSIPFYWDTTKSLYVTKFNRRWWRKY
ncbi:MAG: hypothetical protein PVH88_04805 [Ignavibacteria bacterium]|jgi:hypothetical protein